MNSESNEPMNSESGEKRRVAVITGGAGGIGRATAKRLGMDGVVGALWDVDAVAAEQAAAEIGGGWIGLTCDVTDEASVQGAATATIDAFDGVDILVNGAGILGPSLPVADYTLTEWRKVVAISLDGTFLCCRSLLDHLLASPAGRIVNVSSAAAKDGNPHMSAYVSAKAGVLALTKSLAKEHATGNLRVNAVTPTIIDTDFNAHLDPGVTEAVVGRIPMGRMGTAAEVAELIAWLASEACSFTTGAAFDLSGGRSTY